MIPAVIGIAVHAVYDLAAAGLVTAGVIWLCRQTGP